MRLRKEILYVPGFLIFAYLLEKLNLVLFNDRHFIVWFQYAFLFFTGLFIGAEKVLFCRQNNILKFDLKRMLITVVPLLVILFFTIGGPLLITDFIIYPITIRLMNIALFNHIGFVLSGYFITSSFCKKE
ncbi:MAG TPA: hypothetical protein VIK78_09365 [Ruminiclostridium sp.]